MSPLPSSWRMTAYWVPKDGTATSDWEDGVAYSASSGWFAVADGASRGSSSREWAFTLTSAFVADRVDSVLAPDADGDRFLSWVGRTRLHFDPQGAEFVPTRVPDWVRAAGERTGAYATFVGGHVEGQEIRAVAVGDCCLFHFRAERGDAAAFPLHDVQQFGTAPLLVGSRCGDDERLAAGVRHYRAPVTPGDVIFAASDAFAEWLMRRRAEPPVWAALAAIGNEGFRQLCRDLRVAREIKNDDVTLWRCRVGAP